MEKQELKKILELGKNDYRLRKLYQRHQELERQIETLQNRSFLTTDEQLEEKKLKFEKARGKRRMMSILAAATGSKGAVKRRTTISTPSAGTQKSETPDAGRALAVH
jgi:uncharacterized protein YdcH (DUF465 family)